MHEALVSASAHGDFDAVIGFMRFQVPCKTSSCVLSRRNRGRCARSSEPAWRLASNRADGSCGEGEASHTVLSARYSRTAAEPTIVTGAASWPASAAWSTIANILASGLNARDPGPKWSSSRCQIRILRSSRPAFPGTPAHVVYADLCRHDVATPQTPPCLLRGGKHRTDRAMEEGDIALLTATHAPPIQMRVSWGSLHG